MCKKMTMSECWLLVVVVSQASVFKVQRDRHTRTWENSSDEDPLLNALSSKRSPYLNTINNQHSSVVTFCT